VTKRRQRRRQEQEQEQEHQHNNNNNNNVHNLNYLRKISNVQPSTKISRTVSRTRNKTSVEKQLIVVDPLHLSANAVIENNVRRNVKLVLQLLKEI
jgi:hypothetical protein